MIHVKNLSSGAYGAVSLHVRNLEDVSAVKKIEKLKTDEEDFHREVRTLKSFSIKEGFPVFRNSWEDKKHYYLETSYIPGLDLHSVLKERREGKKMKSDLFRILFLEMARRVRTVHRAGYIHLDIKPGNFMLSGVDEITLMDFGFTLTLEEGLADRESMGTLHYKAPEVVRKKAKTPAADVYSLGCSFYVFLTGDHLFDLSKKRKLADERKKEAVIDDSEKYERVRMSIEKQKKKDVYECIRKGEHIPIDTLNPELNQLIEKMIHVNPVKRIDIDGVIGALKKMKPWTSRNLRRL